MEVQHEGLDLLIPFGRLVVIIFNALLSVFLKFLEHALRLERGLPQASLIIDYIGQKHSHLPRSVRSENVAFVNNYRELLSRARNIRRSSRINARVVNVKFGAFEIRANFPQVLLRALACLAIII